MTRREVTALTITILACFVLAAIVTQLVLISETHQCDKRWPSYETTYIGGRCIVNVDGTWVPEQNIAIRVVEKR